MKFGWLRDPTPKGCRACHEERGVKVEMEATQAWVPSQAAYVDCWACSECGRQVARDEGDGVGMTAPDGERF